MLRYVLPALLLLSLTACKEKINDPLRLNHIVRPTSQSILLMLDPDTDAYNGHVQIEIEVDQPATTFRFHAQDLSIDSIVLQKNENEMALTYAVGRKGLITATAPQELKPGSYNVVIHFSNEYSRQGTGIYKVEYEGKNYLFTQMEPEYARQSFPCWDAPEFKIPWNFTLLVPTNQNYSVYANTPLHTESTRSGWKSFEYTTTRPMPSYLVAFAVGDFEEVDVPGLSIPGKIIVPTGKTKLTSEAARISPPLLKALEDYFEFPYPYQKLDQIAVPEFNFGAMENVGLITYRDTHLLRDPKAITLQQKQWLASIVAHEMSHMWFGNLVTPKWWDDLWLNESFASWIALKMVNQTFPEYEMQNNDIKSRERAFGSDSLSTSRPIRRHIAASDAMDHLFDSLAYNKGMAILDMVEDWMGEEAFRRGMIQYMNDHAWQNADAFDLAESLGEVADGEILDMITSFVTQAGIPLLEFEMVGSSKIRISQKRYTQYGVDPEAAQQWLVPVVLKLGDGSTRKILLTKRSQTFRLDHPVAGLYPNAGEKGYYRWTLPPDHMKALSAEVRELDIRNRLGFISNLAALFSSGAIDAPAYLEIMASFSADESPEVRQAITSNLAGFSGGMIPPELEKAYGHFLATVFEPMLENIGTAKVDGEPALIEKLRLALIDALGWRCRNQEILERATAQATAYMADPYSVDPSLAQAYLRLAALAGDETLFDALTRKYETTTEPTQKAIYLQSLSGFRDPELMKRALDYVLTDAVPPHQFGAIPYRQNDTDENRRLVLNWLMENYPAIQEKIPNQTISFLPWIACGQSPELLEEAKAFLLADERKTQGLEIEFGKAEAVVQLNAGLREKEQENIRRFLEAQ